MRREQEIPHDSAELKATTSLDDDTVDFVVGDETLATCERTKRAAIEIDWAGRTHIGKVRPHNEDHYFVFRKEQRRGVLDTNLVDYPTCQQAEQTYVFAVADGLGGHSFGELASAITLRLQGPAGRDSWLAELAELSPGDVPAQATKEAKRVHRRLLDEAQKNPQLRGMASTLTAALAFNHRLVLIHLGDSRAYLLQADELKQVTVDHTLAQEMKSTNVMDPRMVRMANVLTNCLGGDEGQLRVETHDLRWGAGDHLLICSDGLSDVVTPEEMKKALLEHPTAAEASDFLVNLALERGGRDNITVVIASCRS